jgi:LCP family protein required for cell wall assembly
MRNSNWLFLIGVVAMAVATLVCSVGSFAVGRQIALDMGERGIRVASLGDFVNVVQNLDAPPTLIVPDAPTAAVDPTAEPTTESAVVAQVPTNTPIPTLGGVIPTLSGRGSTSVLPTLPAGVVTTAPQIAPTGEPTPDLRLAEYAWQDPRRFNILLLGIDQRRGEQGPFRTDTIIVVSVDPLRGTAGMLSIPRDLYVPIPGFRQDRINNANVLGEASAYPGGGPALVARTLQENLGINVSRYVLINFDFFTTVVDLIAPNGVEVCPNQEIHDEYYPDGSYGFMTVHFDPGCQRLEAERLLQYARTRHGNSDFDRAFRQQEVIKAVRDEVLSIGGIANFIGQAPRLYQELSDSYRTNMALDDLIRLGALIQNIPSENIASGVIGTMETRFATTPTGDQVLIPNYNAISTLMQRVFNAAPGTTDVNTISVETQGEVLSISELRQRAEAENARIGVYNNTEVAGLASQTRDLLVIRQVTVANVGNMPTPTGGATVIRNLNDKPYTARYLAALLNLPEDRIETGAPNGTDDVMVIVGADIQPMLAGR